MNKPFATTACPRSLAHFYFYTWNIKLPSSKVRYNKLLCIMGQDFLDKLYLTLLGGVGGDGISLKKTLLYSIPR